VRVRDVIAKLRAFAANIAYLCHDFAPNSCVSCRRNLPPANAIPTALRLGLPPEAPTGSMQTHHPGSLPNLQYTRNLPPSQT
jgi:hypothetical protein